MAKVSFANLKLKTKDEVNTIKIGDTEVEVLQYLPIDEKADFIAITVQKAMENGVINPVRFEQWFGLNLMYLYTNFNFTDKQKEDPSKLYDILESNGIIDMVYEAIPIAETNLMDTMFEDYIAKQESFMTSAAYTIGKIISDLPANAAAAASIVEQFNPEKYGQVLDFARAANGGRDIETNQG